MTNQENIAVIRLQGDVDLYRSPEVRKRISEYLGKKIPGVIIDLEGVTFIDSSGLATLIEAMQRNKKYGGQLILTGINEKIKNVFEISRLVDVFTICTTIDEAKQRVSVHTE